MTFHPAYSIVFVRITT